MFPATVQTTIVGTASPNRGNGFLPLYTIRNKAKNLDVAFYFIHIPKCGGTTIEVLFEKLKFTTFLAPKDYREVRHHMNLPPTHYDIALIEKMFRLEKIYSFAIVRNPYDRMLSDYKWAKAKSSARYLFQKMSFEEYCLYCFKQYSDDNNYLANHIRPQHEFVSKNVNKIFKLENGLEAAVKEVFSDLKLRQLDHLVLGKKNASLQEAVTVNQNTRDLIYNFYEKDFKIFGYGK